MYFALVSGAVAASAGNQFSFTNSYFILCPSQEHALHSIISAWHNYIYKCECWPGWFCWCNQFFLQFIYYPIVYMSTRNNLQTPYFIIIHHNHKLLCISLFWFLGVINLQFHLYYANLTVFRKYSVLIHMIPHCLQMNKHISYYYYFTFEYCKK